MSQRKTVALFGYGHWGKKVFGVLKKLGYEVVVVDKKTLDSNVTFVEESKVLANPQIFHCFIVTPEETHFALVRSCLNVHNIFS